MSLRWILLLYSICPLTSGNDCDRVDDWGECYGKVEHVSVLFRHGIRTPVEVYPTDPHCDPGVWPIGYGELTKEGVRQHYVLGSWLGDRYAALLPANRNYNRSVIRVVSSDIDRTIMSAAANMAGMFPLSPEERWGGIDWYPFPVHTIPKELDNKYDAEFLNFTNSEEYREIQDKYKGVMDFAELMSGWNMDVRHFTHLYDSLYIESLYGLQLPRWTRDIFPDAMVKLVGIEFAFPTWTPSLVRLRSGLLLKTLLENMKGKLNGTLTENISVYSGHDTTLAALLNAMGVFDFMPPPFAASVLLELRLNTASEPLVTVFYKNSPDPGVDPTPLCLPGCSFACPLSQLENLWVPLLVHDWDRECEE